MIEWYRTTSFRQGKYSDQENEESSGCFGIVIAGLLGAALLGGCIYYCAKQRDNAFQINQSSKLESQVNFKEKK